jgi:hypothetical protein
MSELLVLLLLPVAAALRAPWQPRPAPTTRVAVLGGGFAGLTAARTLAKDRRIEVLLIDQRDYFEYTPGILRAWVDPTVHRKLVNPIARLLRSKRARFQRVPPGCAASLSEQPTDGGARPLRLVVSPDGGGSAPTVDYECDYAVLATGGEQSPISDDRQLPDGTVLARRKRLGEQVEGVLGKAKSALVVGGGLTGIELAAELAESLGPGAVTLAVGPRLESRGLYPGDPGTPWPHPHPNPKPKPKPNPNPNPNPEPNPNPGPNPDPDPNPDPSPDSSPDPSPDPIPSPSPGPTLATQAAGCCLASATPTRAY